MAESKATAAKTRSFRFSLLSLIYVTTLISLAITAFLQHTKIDRLKAEVRRLHDETQSLHVVNPEVPHAIQVDSDDPLVWKWKVWTPKAQKFKLFCASDQIPAKGYPDSSAELLITKPGAHLISYRVKRDAEHQRWIGHLSVGSKTMIVGEQPWASWEDRSSREGGVAKKNTEFEQGETIVLIRRRVNEGAFSPITPTQSYAGFMIWLEPQ